MKNFQPGEILHAEDLNDITNSVDEVWSVLVDHLTSFISNVIEYSVGETTSVVLTLSAGYEADKMYIYSESGYEIASGTSCRSITANSVILHNQTEDVVYTAKVEKRGVTRYYSVRISALGYSTMYYGNSMTQLRTAEEITTLPNTQQTVVEATYNTRYFYIAVHSSYRLQSVINRGVEPVLENFDLINPSLEIGGQLYKLYECSANGEADIDDMLTFILTITIAQ